jgi:hypothetical protein
MNSQYCWGHPDAQDSYPHRPLIVFTWAITWWTLVFSLAHHAELMTSIQCSFLGLTPRLCIYWTRWALISWFLRFLGFQCYGVLSVLQMLSGDTLNDAVHVRKLDTPAFVTLTQTLVCERSQAMVRHNFIHHIHSRQDLAPFVSSLTV